MRNKRWGIIPGKGKCQSSLLTQSERGWCLGREAFRAELLAATVARVEAGHYGAERQAAGEVRAEGLVRAGLAALGWTEKELCGRAQGNRGKFKK